MQQQIQLLAKAALSSHDNIRELQANLEYPFIYGSSDNKVMAVQIKEGQNCFKLKDAVLN